MTSCQETVAPLPSTWISPCARGGTGDPPPPPPADAEEEVSRRDVERDPKVEIPGIRAHRQRGEPLAGAVALKLHAEPVPLRDGGFGRDVGPSFPDLPDRAPQLPHVHPRSPGANLPLARDPRE